MGMMTRRNVKRRAVKKTAPVNVSEVKEKNFLDEFEEETKAKESIYTKTEINRMSTSELKRLSTQYDIDGAENMTGGELKKVLIEKFNL